MPAPAIELTGDAPAEARAVILDGIRAFNAAATGRPADPRPLSVLVRDGEGGAVLGGLTGRTSNGWLFVELFHLPESLRGAGLGAELLRRAEEEARARGCTGVWLDTFSFQAPGFYRKQGYQPFGELPDYPEGHRRHFLFKRL